MCDVDLFVFDCEMSAQNRLLWVMKATFVAYEVSGVSCSFVIVFCKAVLCARNGSATREL